MDGQLLAAPLLFVVVGVAMVVVQLVSRNYSQANVDHLPLLSTLYHSPHGIDDVVD